jgi:hypothetical protein
MTKFNQKPLKLVVATALGLIVSTGAFAATSGQFVKPAPAVQTDAANAINFSFAIAPNHQVNLAEQAVTTQSDEYYFTVNGSQLNRGVDVYTSQSSALIKISRQGDKGNAFDTSALQLISAGQGDKNLAGKVVSEDQLKQTGVFINATAISLGEEIKPGTFTLSYRKPLSAKNLYVIHVKEKQSPNKLELGAQKQHFLQNENFSFDALMLSNNDTLSFDKVDAYIMSPSGKKFTADVKVSDNGVANISAAKDALNADEIEAPITGLYELHVNAQANSKGQLIRRTGKIAFALSQDTADLNKLSSVKVNSKKPFANIGLTVKTAGRYEVRGILYGHDSTGNLKPVMETHSARNFVSGEQTITMQFDRDIMANSVLKAPYVLQNVRLYDQTRMSRL